MLNGCGGGDSSPSSSVQLPPTAGPAPAPAPTPSPTPTPPFTGNIGAVSFIHTFGLTPSDGAQPKGPLLLASDGNFYGTARAGGNPCPDGFSCGAIFRITPNGVITVLHRFAGGEKDGWSPTGPLIQSRDGALYGMTTAGGKFARGTVFRITLDGDYDILHSFFETPTSGDRPIGALLEASDGLFYGTTVGGGTNNCSPFSSDCGTLFSISRNGEHKVRYSFGSSAMSGAVPNGSLLQASDGNFYGTTRAGGNLDCTPFNSSTIRGCGTVFRFSPSGSLTTLHAFGSTMNDGILPNGPLVKATDGSFYGTTFGGGNRVCLSDTVGCGTVYRINSQGLVSIVYAFAKPGPDGVTRTNQDGFNPGGYLLVNEDGDIYGVTESGGENVQTVRTGTIFRITPAGIKTTLYSFGPLQSAPSQPLDGLTLGRDGAFYGVTFYSSNFGQLGTVFKMTL